MQLLFKFATSPQPVRRYTRCRRFCALHWSWSFRGLQRMHITSADDRQCVQLRRVCLSRMAWLIGLRFTNSLCRDRRAQRCKSIVVNNDPTHKHRCNYLPNTSRAFVPTSFIFTGPQFSCGNRLYREIRVLSQRADLRSQQLLLNEDELHVGFVFPRIWPLAHVFSDQGSQTSVLFNCHCFVRFH